VKEIDRRRQRNERNRLAYARRGMRCIGLAYRDLPRTRPDAAIDALVKNSDGADAEAETELITIGPLPVGRSAHRCTCAIEKCYHAGIDVRLVTGDTPILRYCFFLTRPESFGTTSPRHEQSEGHESEG
jgi:magnesium-transporting ATPase (P-type)